MKDSRIVLDRLSVVVAMAEMLQRVQLPTGVGRLYHNWALLQRMLGSAACGAPLEVRRGPRIKEL